MFEFTIMKDNSLMQLTITDYKQARSFERMLNDFKVIYQLHDNVTTKQDTKEAFSDSEQAYVNYTDKPVTDWLTQIDQMKDETCQINIL